MSMQAVWNGKVIAESDNTETVEGNYYFPEDSVKWEYLNTSETTSVCSWKGDCSYYTVSIDGQDNVDAAWVYADPKDAASNIKGHVAFWKGVEVTAA